MAYCRSKKYVTVSYNGKSARAPSVYFIVVTVSLLATHPSSVVSPPPPTPDASSAINRMQIANVKNPMASPQNVSTAVELTRPILPTVFRINNNTNNSVSYVNANCASRSQPHMPSSSSKLTSELSRRPSPPRPHTTWTQTASQPPTTTDPQSLSTTDPQSLSSLFDTAKFFLSRFNIQNLCHALGLLVLRAQTISYRLSKIMLVLDAVVAGNSSSF